MVNESPVPISTPLSQDKRFLGVLVLAALAWLNKLARVKLGVGLDEAELAAVAAACTAWIVSSAAGSASKYKAWAQSQGSSRSADACKPEDERAG